MTKCDLIALVILSPFFLTSFYLIGMLIMPGYLVMCGTILSCCSKTFAKWWSPYQKKLINICLDS